MQRTIMNLIGSHDLTIYCDFLKLSFEGMGKEKLCIIKKIPLDFQKIMSP